MNFRLLICFTIFFYLTSCENNDDIVYSCDSALDSYIKDNIVELSMSQLSDINTLSDIMQRAVYRTFSPEKKCEIWKEKLHNILDEEEWTIDEEVHIISLLDYLSPDVFTGDEKRLSDQYIDPFFRDNWMDYGYNTLNWDVRKMVFLVSSLECTYDLFLKNNTGISDLSNNAVAITESCSCNQSTSFCYPGICKDTGCAETQGGCGWLWLDDCDGDCFL